MAEYRLKADQTSPRSYKKELQMISYRGDAISSDDGNTLIAENNVYYPRDYLSSSSTPVVLDPESYKENSLSLGNKFSKGRPAALPIEEEFQEESAVSRTLLGINRSEKQQGLFEDVSSYGLDKKDWIEYSGYADWDQSDSWKYKNSPGGRHNPAINFDDEKNSSIVLSSYPVPYRNPGNEVLYNRLAGISQKPGPTWGRYLQSLIAMYIIEHMVNNFSQVEKEQFQVQYVETQYTKRGGKFDRLNWDKIWLDIDQSRVGGSKNIPIIPVGTIVNLFIPSTEGEDLLDLEILGSEITGGDRLQSINYDELFFASTRYVWEEPNLGHYKLKTNTDPEMWRELWKIDYDSLPQDLKDWEFRVLESPPSSDSPEVKYKLPYFLITSKVPSESLLFGSSWPKTYSDPTVPQIRGAISEGNQIGSSESGYSVVTLTSNRAFRYQPGRISGFTYGVRVSEEGAGPGTTIEWGVENFTDGYFFRLKDGTDFSIVRRSIIPLGTTELFVAAGYEEREVYVEQTTGLAVYKDDLTDSEILDYEEAVEEGRQFKSFETVIQQNQMNGDPLNSLGSSGYVYNADTVTMYKIEFGWYGAIGARFYAYIPQGYGNSRWVTLHTLVIENNIDKPCLSDPFFFFKYRLYISNPSRIRLPQFIEKYGASYYIDGGDEGTISVSTSKAINRRVESINLQGFGASFNVVTNSGGAISSISGVNSTGENYSVGDLLSISGPGSPTAKAEIRVSSINETGGILTYTISTPLPFGTGYTPSQTSVSASEVVDGVIKQIESPIYKWGSVIGIKPKTVIINSEGNEFKNKKEIFPISLSVTSTKNAEIKLVNQFGCQENGFTFQEGYKCELPESQRLRGLFSINPLQKQESNLISLGLDKDSLTPTIVYVGPDSEYPEASANLQDGGSFIGWDAYEKSLYGSHLIGDKVYCTYLNPREEGKNTLVGTSGQEAVINRVTFNSYFSGSWYSRPWSSLQLLSRFEQGPYPLKLSRFRRDTTLLSSVSITTNEFYLLFTTKGVSRDTFAASCLDNEDYQTKCDQQKHFGDISIGLLWPTASEVANNSDEEYPKKLYSSNRAKEHPQSFGIIDPNIDSTTLSSLVDNDVYVVVDGTNGNYVVDKTVPLASSYRYYEGLPMNVFSRDVEVNTLKTNSAGSLIANNGGVEVSEGGTSNNTTVIDSQFPPIPGADGGLCHAIYGRVGTLSVKSSMSRVDRNGSTSTDPTSGKDVYYLTKESPWPRDLYLDQEGNENPQIISVERRSDSATISVTTTGDPQQEFTPAGSTVRQYYLPVVVTNSGTMGDFVDQNLDAKYNAISIFAPSLVKKDDRLLDSRVVGQNVFPIRWFIAMKEGAEIGAVSVGQVTPNGIVQTPFSPHGSTLSINHLSDPDGNMDQHRGGTPAFPAVKSVKTIVEPLSLDVINGEDFSYYDVSGGTDSPIDKTKKCSSFTSSTLLSGSGVSSTGDYPIRWLKFKESGDSLASFYTSAGDVNEIDLKSIFNISAESVGPSFWGNKSLFIIAKSLEEGGAEGRISVTLNYKEQ
jgi:hypothetical protein